METRKNDDTLNKINTNFIFEYSKLCYDQLKTMEYMLKEERKRYENQTRFCN